MESIDTLPQKVVERKTVILKSRLDINRARLICEGRKTSFFKYFFRNTQPEDVLLTGLTKFYEPIIVIGGKYSIDYCKKHVFEIKADNQMKSLFLGGEKIRIERFNAEEPAGIFKLTGEEHSHYENETYFMLDKLLREVNPEEIPLAPFHNEMENPEDFDVDFKKTQISLDDEINFLRSKIVKRPSGADLIIRELFEINERLTIYRPIYELSFQNKKNAKLVNVLVDGITGKMTIVKLTKIEENPEASKKLNQNSVFNEKIQFFRAKLQNKPIKNLISEKNSSNSNKIISSEKDTSSTSIPKQDSRVDLENSITLAVDFLKRLGLNNKIQPLKVSPEAEFYVVELGLENRTAKVWINSQTKEVKEYEIQELSSGFS